MFDWFRRGYCGGDVYLSKSSKHLSVYLLKRAINDGTMAFVDINDKPRIYIHKMEEFHTIPTLTHEHIHLILYNKVNEKACRAFDRIDGFLLKYAISEVKENPNA